MHYFIDGYNLLFRLLPSEEDLQTQREAIIYDLNEKISLVKINASVVFDATSQVGERSRSHYDQLEIHYTNEGETADEYIIDEIKNHSNPERETVVTSDKKLAWQVRNFSGRTVTVEQFVQWLNRAYKNKLRRQAEEIKAKTSPPPGIRASSKSLIPLADAPLEAYHDYYAQIFEKEWEAHLAREQEISKSSPPPEKKKCPPRRPKQKIDPFAEQFPPAERAASEMERWQKIFEHRSKAP